MNNQLKYSSHLMAEKKNPLSLILDGVEDPANIGNIIRTADALGVEKVYLSNFYKKKLEDNKIKRVSRSLSEKVLFEFYNDKSETIKTLKQNGYVTVALEITNQSKELNKINFSKMGKIVLVIGSENKGVSQEILDIVDETVHIKMFGYGSSMNVAVATGIACYYIIQGMK